MTFQFLETMPNWAPITDVALINHPISSSELFLRDRIFTTAGRQPFGSVTELRNGYEALMTIRLDNPLFAGSTGLWTFSDIYDQYMLVVVSLPKETVLFRFIVQSGEFDDEVDEESCDLEFNGRTIAMSKLTYQNRIVQITEHSISILRTDDQESWFKLVCKQDLPSDTSIVQAEISGSEGVVIVLARDSVHTYLQLIQIAYPDEEEAILNIVPSTIDILHSLTSFLIFRIQTHIYLLVAYSNAYYDIFEIGSAGFQEAVKNLPFGTSPSADDIAQCESATVIRHHLERPNSAVVDEYLLVCGLRNGSLYIAELYKQDKCSPHCYTYPLT
jgi:hypothetical protein